MPNYEYKLTARNVDNESGDDSGDAYITGTARAESIADLLERLGPLARDADDENKMDRAGLEAGRAAGSWVLDGNSSDADARAVLRMADDCELTADVSTPLAGEWADDSSYADVFADADVEWSPDDETLEGDARTNELLNVWADAWYRGYEDQATQDARAMLATDDIPADFPVRPIAPDSPNATVCGVCGRGWDDSVVTSMTPAPAARCPFEAFHNDDNGRN